MKQILALFFFLLVSTLSSLPANASLLYTETFIGSGTLDGTPFSNAQVTLSVVADPANRTQTADVPPVYLLPGTFDVTVDGIGTVSFGTNGGVVLNTGNGGFRAFHLGPTINPNAPAFLGIFNDFFGTYDLTTPFGPVVGTAKFGSGGSANGHTLFISSTGSVTASAVALGEVPEPGTMFSAALGLGVLALFYRRKTA